jgi:2-methylcitrate dehydratase PrpD
VLPATHAAIEAALELRDRRAGARGVAVDVHPVARAAAARDVPRDGLEAKFSIPYLTAFTLLHGPPGVSDFASLDDPACRLGGDVTVRTDPQLGQMAARVTTDGASAEVRWPSGSPERPLDGQALRRKLRDLAGERLDGVLDDRSGPAAAVARAAGF